ncbi:MAG: ATP-binding protein [Candidatus Anammoxibacter sp.]
MTDSMDGKAADIEQSIKYAEDLAKLYNSEKEKRKEVEAANEKINAVIDSINDGMAATDGVFRIVQLNKALCRILEKDKESLLNKDFLTSIDKQEVKDQLLDLNKTGNEKNKSEFEVNVSNNRVVNVSVSRILNSGGFVFVLHDITAAKRAENIKTEFLSILSHEIRTPLNSVIGFTDILQEELEGKLDEDCIEYLNTIKKNGNRISNTINELLNFVVLQHEGLDSIDEEVDIVSILNDSIEKADGKRKEKHINIELEQLVDKAIIKGSATMLSVLFYHVIENSVIYGNQDGNVNVKLLNEERLHYVISVKDDGIGINAADLEQVFNSFFQAEEYSTRNEEGLGLGLTLAKRIAELHGGDIKIESELHKGTTCYIRLPVNRSEDYQEQIDG